MSTRDLKQFTDAYVEAALWSTSDNADEQGGEPLDANCGPDDIAPPTMRAMEQVCADFFEKYGRLIEDDESRAIDKWGRWELAGHDLWLTSAGHGAGFGDGNFPKHDDELYEAAKKTKAFDLYVGDDGLIYAGGYETNDAQLSERRRAPRQHAVRDFNTLPEVIEHARGEGATHVVAFGSAATLYFPRRGGGYEEARLYRERGYWHAPAESARRVVDRLPAEAQPIDAYLAGQRGRRAAESNGRDPQGRDRERDDLLAVLRLERGGSVHPELSSQLVDRYQKLGISAPELRRRLRQGETPLDVGQMREAFGRRTQWSDWQILDAIDRGQMVTPEAERRAVKLAQLGFIDTTGTWRLTPKGRRAVDQRTPVAAETAGHRDGPEVWFEGGSGLLDRGWYAWSDGTGRVGPFDTRDLARAAIGRGPSERRGARSAHTRRS